MKRAALPAVFATVILMTIFLPAGFGAEENKDSLAIVTAKWNEEQLNKKVTFKQCVFEGNLFESNQIISIIEIKGAKAGKKGSPYFALQGVEELTRTSDIAKENDALAAVNGNFFSFKKPHNSVDYLRVDGIEICGNGGDGTRSYNQSGVIAIDKRGRVSLHKPDSADKQWERRLEEPSIMTAGPLLMADGIKEPLKNVSFYTTRHPRTAVAILDNNTVLLVTVDGRNASAQGMSLEELQKTISWLGAKHLINLDGGGSTTMYIKDKGVVNYPSDNKKLDHFGERKVANALLLLISE